MIVGKSAVLVEKSASTADFSKRLVNFCTFRGGFSDKVLVSEGMNAEKGGGNEAVSLCCREVSGWSRWKCINKKIDCLTTTNLH